MLKLYWENETRVINLDRVKVYRQCGSRLEFDGQIHIEYASEEEAIAMFKEIVDADSKVYFSMAGMLHMDILLDRRRSLRACKNGGVA